MIIATNARTYTLNFYVLEFFRFLLLSIKYILGPNGGKNDTYFRAQSRRNECILHWYLSVEKNKNKNA